MTHNSEFQPNGIPIRIRKADPSTPLPSDYSTTPQGTIFSTTPGGTRIIYDRNTLLNLRNSPLSQTPPKTMGHVPGVTSASYKNSIPLHHSSLSKNISPDSDSEDDTKKHSKDAQDKKAGGGGEMFDMELE
ncbi:eukaryotic translation initiation factor 4E binding protein [Conidiobolus coronatus NRRL 28638]|uniref:Eukaryotic translation initiation factor 4E binding protein n=1 Tax=Conidiobolus coronatus (strain ATCC 28846 / CBS 209.66 / NRRL 28638) TaxID=796925 RepID=A0A137NYC6_CONC2|nr:eukaryotic translation initiation factor 4E binding protein [Conidiobolus coronatus NRRL 28638]|eukprot:KXN67654.1 eukaryotic translation initiation factor 4E binding protein [Conidiobolus coronatus NRRL 28638]